MLRKLHYRKATRGTFANQANGTKVKHVQAIRVKLPDKRGQKGKGTKGDGSLCVFFWGWAMLCYARSGYILNTVGTKVTGTRLVVFYKRLSELCANMRVVKPPTYG